MRLRSFYLVIVDASAKEAETAQASLASAIKRGALPTSMFIVGGLDVGSAARFSQATARPIVIIGTGASDDEASIAAKVGFIKNEAPSSQVVLFAALPPNDPRAVGTDLIAGKPAITDLIAAIQTAAKRFPVPIA